jgi:pilus assembly protein Flp/PilA
MLSNISAALLRFVARFEREEGQALAEYGLILALIAVAAILALTALGLAIAGQLDAIEAVMPFTSGSG